MMSKKKYRVGLRAIIWASVLAWLVCGCFRQENHVYTGYVELDLVYIGPNSSGYLQEIRKKIGDEIHEGEILAQLDDARQKLQLAQARASLKSSQWQLANWQSGLRPMEVSLLEKELAQLKIELGNQKKNHQRLETLYQAQAISQELYENSQTSIETLEEKIEASQLNIDIAKQGSRNQQIEQAKAQVEIAKASLAEAELMMSRRQLISRLKGKVKDIYYDLGEWVNLGSPVIAIQPERPPKIIFFVPQPKLARIQPGQHVSFRVDGNEGVELSATIETIATQAEFTPPILFDRNNRQKLVYKVEARLEKKAKDQVKLGQPVEVSTNNQ